MLNISHENGHLLSFFLGPVQSFITAARSVRDLWTGSYLLSWLTVHAMKPVHQLVEQDRAAIISPSIEGNPLLWVIGDRKGPAPAGITTPCLPNNFKAWLAPEEDAADIAVKCVRECRRAWSNISEAVKSAILKKLDEQRNTFQVDINGQKVDLLEVSRASMWGEESVWKKQVESFFEIRAVVLNLKDLDPARSSSLLGPETQEPWSQRLGILAGIMDAQKSVRHVPAYQLEGEVAQKCTLLGSYEQMGPAQLDESRKFWEEVSGVVRIGGTKTSKNERLCAISLVKRFAWAAYLSRKEVLDLDPRKLRFADTATAAAELWLRAEPPLPYQSIRQRFEDWSGHWIHWTRPDQDRDEPCPDEIWAEIEPVLRKKRQRLGRPPTYYAILMFDADNLGVILRDADQSLTLKVSRALTRYALEQVRDVVEKHGGELIYSGGDDTLAIVPAETVIACARQLNDQYRRNWEKEVNHRNGEATTSAGVAVVHYKEDLRFALNQARAAEHRAKESGRDALGLCICRRSGEHTTVVMDWKHTQDFQDLVEHYRNTKISDRWAYRMREDLPTLGKIPWDAVQKEIDRQLARLEAANREERDGFIKTVRGLREGYHGEMHRRGAKRERIGEEVVADLVVLFQSASFMVRGRDEG